MLYKLLLVLLISINTSLASECSLYEKSHPAFLLDGAHLSTGKCKTCATCHINSIFIGTPKTCKACHSGDPARQTVGKPKDHPSVGTKDCNASGCHNTRSFNK